MDTALKPIPITLNGENYFYWSKAAKATLSSKGLWNHTIDDGFSSSHQVETQEGIPVQGLQTQQAAQKEKAKWHQEDQLALVLLQGSLDQNVLQSFIALDSTKALWDALKEVYGNLSNISRIYEIKKKLSLLQQQGRPFNKVQGEYTSLWNELEEIRPVTMDPKIVVERAEEDKVFGLLLALDASFNDLVYHLLRQSKLPPFSEVCMMIKREEGGRNLFSGSLEMAHFTKKPFSPLSTPREKRSFLCDHCKKPGHTKERCWILNPHLKPSRYKDHPPTKGVAMSAGNTISSAGNTISFTQDEFKQFVLAMKEKDTGNFSSILTPHIVIDSGATTHMFKDKNLFYSIEKSYGVVTVANGKFVPIEGHGIVRMFGKEFSALYVPEFSTNLLSIPKLVQDSNCRVVFDTNGVLFQDIKSDHTFGKGIKKGNLYYVEDFLCFSDSTFHVSHSLLHARLGHPHNKVLKLLFPQVKDIVVPGHCKACVL
ncbi:PREDICTED: uncharacterized protein LOC104806043, partial [Tarenaya hassleriana]|uniref:uncharacterized protein LOC104806043 n=1 Tax=Tarenaya hassleriana TaxID=28532 RepID=UPI00053C8480